MSDPIIESLREKLLKRSQRGLEKYGVGLDREDLTTTEWLQHAQEEALDLAGYLERLIQDQDKLKIAVEALLDISKSLGSGHIMRSKAGLALKRIGTI